PAPRRRGALEVKGRRDGLAGDCPLQRQAPGVERGFGPGGAWRWRRRLPMGRVGEERRAHGSEARGRPERLHRTGARGGDLLQAGHGLVPPEAPFDRPAPTGAVGHRSRADPRRQVRAEEPVAFRRVDPDAAAMPGGFGTTPLPIGVNGPAVAPEERFRQADLAGGPREARLGQLSTRHRVDRGLPVVCEADDNAPPVVMAGPQPGQAGRGEVGEPTAAPPGCVARQMPAIMLPGGADVGAHRCPTADREDLLHVHRGGFPRPGALLAQGVAPRARRRIDAVPVVHATKGTRQLDLRRPRRGQGALGPRRHEPLQGCIKPAIAGGAGDLGPLTRQRRAQDVGLVGSARRPRGNDHRTPPHPEVQLALPRHAITVHAQAVDRLLGQDRLEHCAPVVARPVGSRLGPLSALALLVPHRGGVEHAVA
ncbi:MAG: hypothetical protein ACRERE_34285, partial [Candidatus Entotheonellia bacterium]